MERVWDQMGNAVFWLSFGICHRDRRFLLNDFFFHMALFSFTWLYFLSHGSNFSLERRRSGRLLFKGGDEEGILVVRQLESAHRGTRILPAGEGERKKKNEISPISNPFPLFPLFFFYQVSTVFVEREKSLPQTPLKKKRLSLQKA